MRSLTYILLGVMLLQVSGVRDVCFCRQYVKHDCCPASKDNSLPSQPSIPDCCLSMALTLQSSIAEPAAGPDHAVSLQSNQARRVADPIAPRPERQPEILASSGLTLPHIPPLLQTCLLLI